MASFSSARNFDSDQMTKKRTDQATFIVYISRLKGFKEESAKKRFTKAPMSADTLREKLQGYLKQECVDGVIPEIVGDEGMRFLVPIGIAGDF